MVSMEDKIKGTLVLGAISIGVVTLLVRNYKYMKRGIRTRARVVRVEKHDPNGDYSDIIINHRSPFIRDPYAMVGTRYTVHFEFTDKNDKLHHFIETPSASSDRSRRSAFFEIAHTATIRYLPEQPDKYIKDDYYLGLAAAAIPLLITTLIFIWFA